MVRPLTPLRRVHLKRPLPAGDSFVVCQVMRRRPVSELTSPTVVEPWPDHDPTCRVTGTIARCSDGFELQQKHEATKNTKPNLFKCISKTKLRVFVPSCCSYCALEVAAFFTGALHSGGFWPSR